ncbi:regulation of nuclear pre-mRNA domain-containing protein 1A-like isoform X2 [Denticeps clupeoides]|uniref:regulation of nuclear pre-mRNA domain-containing protein 1A-like isoform X2 n=1 Tax=Denticeps clupeoides TaxID=299321 RepID=UPI0010A58A61|nr:regulation of nuclear pre-mRNA domain-containing protein 1A-like isoform X2 [Denticeps clupeoides]
MLWTNGNTRFLRSSRPPTQCKQHGVAKCCATLTRSHSSLRHRSISSSSSDAPLSLPHGPSAAPRLAAGSTMSVFSEAALEKKLSELSNSQQSVQTLSLWLIHHRKHSKTVVSVWYNELKKAQVSRKLTFLYLANDVIQNSKRKGPEFTQDFAPVIVDAFQHVASEGEESCKKQLSRVLSIWQERAVYESDVLEQLSQVLHTDRKAKKRPYEDITVTDEDFASQSSPSEPPQTAELIRALQELENAASSDSALRQRISSLPAEVQDTSLLHRITDKESGERLSRMVEEACLLLADYSGRLAAEIDDRRQLSRTLTLFLQSQRQGLVHNEQKLEEYKQKLARVTQVRKELRTRLSSLPDLSHLPSVMATAVHLPSPADLYSHSE